MAFKEIYHYCGHGEADAAGMVGKIVNVYNSYANALSHSSTGLLTGTYLRNINKLTGLVSDTITQTAKTAGLTVDNNGCVHFAVDQATYSEIYLMSEAGRWGGPRRLGISSVGTDLASESSSSSTVASVSSSSSSSSTSSSNSSSVNSSSSSSLVSSLSSSSSSTAASNTSSSSSSSSTAASNTSSSSEVSSLSSSSSNSSSSSSNSSSNSSSSSSSSSSSPSSESKSSSSSST